MTATEATEIIRSGEREIARLRRLFKFAERQSALLPPKEAMEIVNLLPDFRRLIGHHEHQLFVAKYAAVMLGADAAIPTTFIVPAEVYKDLRGAQIEERRDS
jgi:hypothetical protein